MLTGHGTIQSAVEGMKLGAFDFLLKPADFEELTGKLIKAREHKKNRWSGSRRRKQPCCYVRAKYDLGKRHEMDPTDMTEKIDILLVDDENDFRQILAKRLKRRGICVREADRGEKALQILTESPVDVVILDVKMPGIDGIECLRRIKETHDLTEVIMLTGHADIQGGVEGIKSGAFDYLSKPVELEHLIRKIKQAFHKIQRILAEKEAHAFKEQVKQQMVVAERLVALGTMASGVAHEINNPLAVIQDSAGWLQQILEKPEMQSLPRREDFKRDLTGSTPPSNGRENHPTAAPGRQNPDNGNGGSVHLCGGQP